MGREAGKEDEIINGIMIILAILFAFPAPGWTTTASSELGKRVAGVRHPKVG